MAYLPVSYRSYLIDSKYKLKLILLNITNIEYRNKLRRELERLYLAGRGLLIANLDSDKKIKTVICWKNGKNF